MRSQNRWGLLFVLPFIIGCTIFFVFPVIFSAYISFTRWDLFNPPEWIGLKNWIDIFKDKAFWTAFRNVFYFALIFVPLQTLFALIVAYMLNQNIRGKTFYRVLYFLPVVTPWVAGAIVWQSLYNHDVGLINWLLSYIGVKPLYWYESDLWWAAIGSIAIMNVWKGMGQSMVMFLAGMQNVSSEVIEASHIDGANRSQIFRKIVIPIISPMIFLVMILSSISAFTAFDVFLTMFDIFSIPDRNNVVNLLIYRDAFVYNKMGYASAISWVLFGVILTITAIQKKLEKRWVHYEN